MHHTAKAGALATGLGLQADPLLDRTLCPDSNYTVMLLAC